MLADAARLGVIRRGRPGGVGGRGRGCRGSRERSARPGRLLTAEQVADELDVTLGALAVTERELARVLNLSRYAHRGLDAGPAASSLSPDPQQTLKTYETR
jgi:hypothetical protein